MISSLVIEPGHDGDRHPELGHPPAGQRADQRARAALVDAGAEHQHADLGVGLDVRDHRVDLVALADGERRGDALALLHAVLEELEMRLDLLVRLGAHHVGDAHEVLELLGRDHRQHLDPAAGLRRPERRVAHGVQHLGRVVEDDQELAQGLPRFRWRSSGKSAGGASRRGAAGGAEGWTDPLSARR